jgi:hypothetical protein
MKSNRQPPSLFPGTVKVSVLKESHYFFCALTCVQTSLEMIQNAEKLFDEIINQLERPGCKRLYNVTASHWQTFAHSLGKILTYQLYNKRSYLMYERVIFLIKLIKLLPILLINRDNRNLVSLINNYIVNVFN